MKRCACGYGPEWHEGDLRVCPLCACGKTPDEHSQVTNPPAPFRSFGATGPVMDPPAPLRAAMYIGVALRGTIRVQRVCPGKPRTAAGALPQLRRGSWREPPVARYERRPGWGDVMFPVAETKPVDDGTIPPPLIPARPAAGPDEIPTTALRYGMKLAAHGCAIEPWYYQDHTGAEGCVLVIRHGELRAAAYWERPAAGSWKAARAVGWRVGGYARWMGVKALADLLGEVLAS